MPFGTPPATFSTPKVPVATGRPELVIVACTLLAIFAAFGLYVAVAASSFSSVDSLSSSVTRRASPLTSSPGASRAC